MGKLIIIASLALILSGCGEATPPDNCVTKNYTYYTYNSSIGGWQGPVTRPLCVVQ